ncbi:MAG: MFS transporter [Actinomycetota bacterium]|nr:MFS transporter [Actinomycetota bacterium]
MALTTTEPGGQLTAGRRRLILIICCLSLLIVGIDSTIVNVALPSIQRSLHASVSGLQWTIDAYTLVLASLLMLSGSTADRFGRRRVFQLGLVLFTIGSLLCSLAPGLPWLVAFRIIQAVGGSMLNPVALSIITNTITDRRERARALGVWGAVFGLSLALGPVVGGVLVSSIGWRAIFWMNIPVGIAAIILTQCFVPESRAPRARRFDPAGQALVIVMLATLTYAVIEGPHRGWGSALIVGLFAVTVLAAATLVAVERRRDQPLLDVRFFRSAPFSGATVIALASFAAFGGFLFLNSLYLQDVRGFTALHAGLLTLPMAGMIALFAPVSGRLVANRGARTPLVLAGPAIGVGAILLIRLGPHTSVGYLVLSYVIFGIGLGFVNAPISNTAVSGMPIEQAGVAASVASTSRQVGATLGVAITGALVAGGTGTSFTVASHAAWAVIAGCGVVVLFLGFMSTGRWAAGTAERSRRSLAADDGPANATREVSGDSAADSDPASSTAR